MDNGMESMLDMYLYETNSLLNQLDEMLVVDEKIEDFSSDDVSETFRIMHTIKGSLATMELGSLSVIAHHIEDLFFYIRDKGTEFLNLEHRSTLFNLMSRLKDYLCGEISKVEGGVPLSDHVESSGRKINDFLKEISGFSRDALPSFDQDPDAAATTGDTKDSTAPLSEDPSALFYLHIFLDDGVGMEDLRAFMIVNSLREREVNFRYYPGDMNSDPETCQETVDDDFLLVFDSRDMASHAEELIKPQNHIRSHELVSNPTSAPGSEEASEGQSPSLNVPTPDSAPMVKAAPPAASASQQIYTPIKQSLISVNLMKLDSLVDIVGETVITESMVTLVPEPQLLSRDNFGNSTKSGRQPRKLTDDLQDIAMSLRMVPIPGVFQKMNRIVRDMNQKLNKDARLTIIGEDTEVDKTTVDSIQDPIMHFVRNSMDHGIEEAAQKRVDAGEESQGEITLSASHTSGEVVISISDDGYGVSPGKLFAKAREKGLLTEPESEYSRKEASGLIVLPGFSTNQVVTEYSDRGVGMDMVKKNVESVGGTISISSEDEKGTTVTMNIPLTPAIVDGMKATVGNSIFTILISNIRQSFKVDAGQIILDEYGDEMVRRTEHSYPIVRLRSFYNLETETTSIEDGILMWVEVSDHFRCLFVDDLIREQQVVIKPLPVSLNSFNLRSGGIVGCTIPGDGNISIILDIAGFYAVAIENI